MTPHSSTKSPMSFGKSRPLAEPEGNQSHTRIFLRFRFRLRELGLRDNVSGANKVAG